MPSISPHTTALFIVLAVGFGGAIAAYLRDRARFRGYHDLTAGAIRLARALKGDLFRDGVDLVASGSWNQLPVQVRFSHAENTPGLDIRMGAPATFTLSVTAASAADTRGRVRVRTPDEHFNARYAVRSDDPLQARLFLSARGVTAALQGLFGISQSFLLITTGQIELSELGIPDSQSPRRALEHMEFLGQLAQQLRAMPGAETVKIEPFRRPRAWPARVALAVGVLVAVAALVMAARPGAGKPQTPERDPVAGGIAPHDAERIPALADWRLAAVDDFDPAALNWMRMNHVPAEARVEGSFCGAESADVAYLLVRPNRGRRLVILCEGAGIYDTRYPYIGMISRIPRDRLTDIKWETPPSEAPQGKALLITLAPDDIHAGLILYFRGRRLISGVPSNYQSVRLE